MKFSDFKLIHPKLSAQKNLSPEKYIITRAHELPFHECFVNKNWKTGGMASIAISKTMPSGKFIVGLYMIDIFCLGLKDTLFQFALDSYGYHEFMERTNAQSEMIQCDLGEAHNLIYGAIDFAAENGFKPQKDFVITKQILDENLIDDRIDDIEFGRNGRPFYFAGPYDNTRQIIETLEKNVGKGNFDVVLPGG
jgi:hypothetical protein